MIGEAKAKAVLQAVIDKAGGDQIEAVLVAGDRSLTRYADNQIHQNVTASDATLTVRVAVGRRLGVVTTNDLRPDSLAATVERARTLAKYQPENPHFPGFAPPAVVPPYQGFHAATAEATAQDRAELVHVLAGMMRAEGISACGRVSTDVTELAVANTNGLLVYDRATAADMIAVVSNDDGGHGYASRVSPSFAALGVEALAQEAIETCRLSEDPVEIPAGAYDVVLKPYAVGALVEYLSYAGFGGLAFTEGRSFMSGKLGQPVTGERISIWDDARDPYLPGMAFDYEGVPKRRLELISNGVARGVAHDLATAARAGTTSTGHALPPPNTEGPAPMHLVMAGGDQTLDQLVRQVERGLLVTRFHYTNLVEPKSALATGLTRDGLLLIENGEITRAVRNLRFTEAIPEAFRRCEGLTRDWQVEGEFGARVRAPGMLIRQFRFNGQAGS